MKTKIKLALSAIIILFILLLAGCKEKPISIDPPSRDEQVRNIVIEYNEERIVSGIISTDLSAETIKISANVTKTSDNVDGSVVFESSDNSIATIDQNGLITLVSEGEVIITAKAGDKAHSIVLVIGNTLAPKPTAHVITIIGGRSDKTSAAEGEYVTLIPEIPEHKKFIRWDFYIQDEIVSGVELNGNVFEMMPNDVLIKAVYEDMLYKLNVINGFVVGNQDYDVVDNMKVYEYKYGSEFSIMTDEADEDKMFVGWDYQVKNNRHGQLGEKVLTNVVMPGENLTIWAVYSEKSDMGFPTASNSFPYNGSGFKIITNGIPEDEESDEDLQGMSGARFAITSFSTVLPEGDYSEENITGSNLQNGEKGSYTLRALFKNHHQTASVTGEFYATYYGTRTTTGVVTVPANSVVEVYFTADLGFNNPWMGFILRKAPEISTSDVILLDMVVEKAPTYPEGDRQFEITGNAKWVNIGNYSTNTGWPREKIVINQAGMSMMAVYGGNFEDTNAYTSAIIQNLPALEENELTTKVYFRVINTNQNKGTFRFVFSTDSNVTDVNARLAYKDFVIEGYEVLTFAIEVPRNESAENIYFGMVKHVMDSSDVLYGHNFVMQMAYNNIFMIEE